MLYDIQFTACDSEGSEITPGYVPLSKLLRIYREHVSDPKGTEIQVWNMAERDAVGMPRMLLRDQAESFLSWILDGMTEEHCLREIAKAAEVAAHLIQQARAGNVVAIALVDDRRYFDPRTN